MKSEIDEEKLTAIKEFLVFFNKKRHQIIKKIEKLSLIEKRGDIYQPNERP